jgi:hypothetical protein
MPYALLSLLWISVVSLFVTFSTGLHLLQFSIKAHVILALTATTLALFAHTMTMFYFIGTGKKIKEFVSTWDERTQQEIRQKIIQMKRKIFPGMTLVCLLLMAAFILGGAYDARVISKPVHFWVSTAALVYHVHVVLRETFYLFKNVDLISEVNHESRNRANAA